MDSERWLRVEEVFVAALEMDADKRAAFLDAQCVGDSALRQEVEHMLAADRGAAGLVASAVGETFRSLNAPLASGQVIGPYQIVAIRGRGGMGVVYHARRSDDVFSKDVAIKVVSHPSPAFIRRFQRERRILARLEHPSIARVLDGGTTDEGLPYLVMELVDGRNLLDYAAEQRLDLRDRLRLFLPICDAVEYAHQNQIVHRDLKPANIMVDGHGRPRVLDFGIASLAEGGDSLDTMTAGQGILTPRYASPEQVKGEPVTAVSDVYALGLLLFELLTGCAAHRLSGESPAAIVKAVCDEEVPPPSAVAAAVRGGAPIPVQADQLEGDLDRIVLRAVEKDPQRRYESVRALADDIGRHLDAVPVSARDLPGGGVLRFARRHATRPAAAIGLSAAAIIMAVYFARPFNRAARPVQTGPPVSRIMLAVLPLENLTGSGDQEYFVDGLHEEVIARLGRLQPERLAVIARTSMLQYKERKKTIAQIGRELGAHYVLEGSVRRAGQRIRVTALLIQVSDQTQRWIRNYEREIGDLFSVQSEIAAQVADSLAVDVLPQSLAATEPHSQIEAATYAEYLRGLQYWHRRWLDYPANVRRAVDHFEAVVRAAPAYAEGHAALAQSYHYWATYPALPAERAALLAKSRAALVRALALDNRLASAKGMNAWIRFRVDWDWQGAEQELREALELDPNSADNHQRMATLLAYTGQWQEADHEVRLAQELDPLSFTLQATAFYVNLSLRRWDQALAITRRLAELAPSESTHVYFASLVLALQGDCTGALAKLATVSPRDVEPESGALGEEHLHPYVLASCGRPREAMQLLKPLEQRPQYLAQRIALVYAALGNRPRALGWLEESYRRREEVLTQLATDPRFAVLHGESRFQALLRRMGFPESATNHAAR